MNKFCENLINLRKETKVSQSKIADKLGVAQQCVSRWEKGLSEPTLSNLIGLADFFGVPLDYLVGRKDF